MNVSDLLNNAASNTAAPCAPVVADAPRSVVRYFIAQPVHLRTGEPTPGTIPFVFTRECLNRRPMQAVAIVNGRGWCQVAEISSAEWLKVTLAQRAHDDAQGDGGQPAVLVPVVPMLPSGGVSVDPAPVAIKPKKLSGIAARVAAGMAK